MTFKTRGKPGRTVLLLAILLVAQSVRTESVLAADIDTSTLRLKIEVAFPNVKWPLWAGGEATGVVNPLRPILVGNAGDGSNRVFIPTQQGVIYVLRNDRRTADAKVFLDLRERYLTTTRPTKKAFWGWRFTRAIVKTDISSSTTRTERKNTKTFWPAIEWIKTIRIGPIPVRNRF
jgi:hypothetical protein